MQSVYMNFKIAGGTERDQDTEDKNQNVQNQKVPPADSCIGKKGRNNKKHADQNSDYTRGQKVSGSFEKHNNFKESIKKSREKKKF